MDPKENETNIPTYWFDERKSENHHHSLPYCRQNESITKKFIQELRIFTQGHFKFKIVWLVRFLFNLKDKESTCQMLFSQAHVKPTKRTMLEKHVEISKWYDWNISYQTRHMANYASATAHITNKKVSWGNLHCKFKSLYSNLKAFTEYANSKFWLNCLSSQA